jgi:hypothetical protein
MSNKDAGIDFVFDERQISRASYEYIIHGYTLLAV